jgi:multisubunit Na+/H+ antiporter MnhB subunit
MKSMKEKLLNCFTCTAIEIMTAIGVTLYLLYLNEPILALISTVVFAKLIVFHFIMDYYDKKQNSQTLSLKTT